MVMAPRARAESTALLRLEESEFHLKHPIRERGRRTDARLAKVDEGRPLLRSPENVRRHLVP